MQGDATGLDPRGHWNRTSSEESTNSEEMDRGRMKKRNKMKESGDSTTKLEDPTLQGVGKGRLSELLKFYEKLEEEALKSGHRSVLFRPPYPCPASKVWKKRSRSCAPKLSATDSAKQRMEPRALSAEDAELCEALERMAGDSDVDESMRTAFLSVIKEIQEQAETDTQPQQGSNDAEQEGEHTGIKRKRSVQFAPSGDEVASTDPKHKKNDSKATQEAEGSCEQENWTDPEQIDLLPCLDSAAPDCQRLLESLEDELMRTSVSPGPQYRGSPRSGSKAERISKVITFVIVLLALASLGSNGVWPLSQLFR